MFGRRFYLQQVRVHGAELVGVRAAGPGDTWLSDGTWRRPGWTIDELVAAKAGRAISVVLPPLSFQGMRR